MNQTSEFRGFPLAAFRFLRGLARHNAKPWFEAQRATYESAVRAPMRALVEELDVRLAQLAPEFVGDPRRSLFRIHRDVRFSADKRPYKTHASCWLFHRDAGRGVGREAHGGAGFYVHLEPGASLVAGGLWMPPPPALARIRAAFEETLPAWEAAVLAPAFVRRFGRLTDDEPGVLLTRLPRGYAPGHAAERWLRFKSFTVSRPLTDAQMASPRLVEVLLRDFALMVPMNRWLNRALGHRPATVR